MKILKLLHSLEKELSSDLYCRRSSARVAHIRKLYLEFWRSGNENKFRNY